MNEETKKALENLQKAINDGEFEEYFKEEKRINDYLDSKVRRWVEQIIITPQLEKKFVDWFTQYKLAHNKRPILWESFLNLIIEDGEKGSVWDNQPHNINLVATLFWKGYLVVQFWPDNEGLGSLFIVYKDQEEILRM